MMFKINLQFDVEMTDAFYKINFIKPICLIFATGYEQFWTKRFNFETKKKKREKVKKIELKKEKKIWASNVHLRLQLFLTIF